MLNVTREQHGSTLVLRLSGEIDERVKYEEVFAGLQPDTVLYCKEISRLNSLGVKHWIHFFQAQAKEGVKLRLVECSPAIVEQLNLIVNFACGGQVESVYVPFNCPSCKKTMIGLFTMAELKQRNYEIADAKCTKCGGVAMFDDVPEEYFRFATRA